MKKILFIDRDGTLIKEPENDKQVDSLQKFALIPGVISALRSIVDFTDYHLVIVSNQDGLGTSSFPMEDFVAPHNLMLEIFSGEGIRFDEVLIDKSFPEELSPYRKPAIGMVEKYMNEMLDYENSYVIGDRVTDIQLADNMGVKSVFFASSDEQNPKANFCSDDWSAIASFLINGSRSISVTRKTTETNISIDIDLNNGCKSSIKTGLGFFDHMLEQISRHADIGLNIKAKGDLHVDEHHTIEDVGLLLGEAFKKALGDKKGINRYGFALPMDDSSANVLLDFGGRAYLVWNVEFKQPYIGDFPTDMAKHFWNSFAQGAACNLQIDAVGENDHHKIEAIFKAIARAIKQAIEVTGTSIPSSKGVL